LAGLNRMIERTIAGYPRIFRPIARRLVPRLSGTAVASHRLAGFALACLGSSIGQRVVARTRLRTDQSINVYRGTAVGEAIARNGVYEPETADLIARLLRPGMCFLDIGANVGQYTLLAADLVGSKGSVIAFEADPSIAEILRENVMINDLSQVTIEDVALAEEDGSATFHIAAARYAGSGSLAAGRHASGRTVTVPTRRLDRLLTERHVDRVDLIKIDVEGAELDVLRGSSATLKHYGLPPIILEFSEINLAGFSHGSVELQQYLEDEGYELFEVESEGLCSLELKRSRSSTYFNVLAIARGQMAEPNLRR
jgi:FkbM family methyltransferase